MHSDDLSLSVHDNNVYAYLVECKRRRVTLHTSFCDREPHEFTDVVFTGVLAHCFEHTLEGNILFDIEEIDVGSLVQDRPDVFKTSWQYSWPSIEYRGDVEQLTMKLREKSIRGFQISSSYGLNGWVLAENCDRIAVTAPLGEA